MHRVRLSLSIGLIFLFLVGCSSGPANNNAVTSSGIPVSLSMTDDPPSGVNVLFFQISLTAAALTPASGSTPASLLPNNTPIEVDVTQLQALAAFLSTANVPAATYNNLTLTFANPQLVIYNASDQSIASSCPVGTICQLTPQIDNSATLTFSSAPFPVTVTENSPVGFLLDFHLDQVIQSDLSVNLSVANGVTVKQLPATPPFGPPQFGFVFGAVQNVDASQNQFTLQTRWGWTFTVDVNSSTSYENFPSSVCSASAFSCLASGQIVQVQIASVQSDGSLLAASVSYVQAASQQVVLGDVINLSTQNGNTVMTLLLRWSPNAGILPFGGMASVTVPSTAPFSVDSGTFTVPSGLSFASTSDLLVGQEVQVGVAPGTLSNNAGGGPWSPPSVSFTASSVQLEPSQVTGTITAIDTSNTSFTVQTFSNFGPPWTWNWTPTDVTVLTTSQTAYQDGNSSGFSGLTTNSVVSVGGWLFSTPNGATPTTQLAKIVRERPNGFF